MWFFFLVVFFLSEHVRFWVWVTSAKWKRSSVLYFKQKYLHYRFLTSQVLWGNPAHNGCIYLKSEIFFLFGAVFVDLHFHILPLISELSLSGTNLWASLSLGNKLWSSGMKTLWSRLTQQTAEITLFSQSRSVCSVHCEKKPWSLDTIQPSELLTSSNYFIAFLEMCQVTECTREDNLITPAAWT